MPPVVPDPTPEDAIADLNILSAARHGRLPERRAGGAPPGHVSPARIVRTFGRTVVHLAPSLLAISFMVGLAYRDALLGHGHGSRPEPDADRPGLSVLRHACSAGWAWP